MTQKPEIQYVGQFYVYGSEAKQVAPARQPGKQRQTMPELVRPEKEKLVVVDPVALVGILAAVALLVSMALGALQIRTAWEEYYQMERYLDKLQVANSQLQETYRASYDLEEIRATAVALGMIPASEAELIILPITPPVPEPQDSWWEETVWFLKGLFA